MRRLRDDRPRISAIWALLGYLYPIVPLPTLAACQLLQVADSRVASPTQTPLIDGKINGKPIRIAINSGNNASFLVGAEARQLGLPMRQHSDSKAISSQGLVNVLSAKVQQLQIGSLSVNNFMMRVVDTRSDTSGIAVMLGTDFISAYDTEFDLGKGTIRLFRNRDCKTEQLAYWSNGYFLTKLEGPSGSEQHIVVPVELNGRSLKAWLLTGLQNSTVSRSVAERLGIKLGTDAAPKLMSGVWQAQFDRLAIGNETIHNPILRVADFAAPEPDLYLGVDFLLAHRVMIAATAHQMLFTYNGGSIFRAAAPYDPEAELDAICQAAQDFCHRGDQASCTAHKDQLVQRGRSCPGVTN